ncbi:MAG TPA: ABC transporter ATP-binding protein, partial [Candidatus Hydrogenedentes bacterium]|nr:ABC transporter ATP-binding protein [Candidatus Hydrogenedentota bacterium]
MTTAIQTRGLSKTYKTFGKPPVHSLRSVDLEVHENEIFGFLGRNGAGKTTAIKLLTGLIYPSSGTAALFDKDARLPEARRMVGYMPEHPYFYEYLTPHETLAFYGRLRGLDRAARDQEWDRISGLLDLRDIADRRIRSFSKGMRQRVGFAVALVGDPPLLLLDEPVSGLDPLGRRRIRELMRELKEAGKTIFFSSHVLADVEEICDRVGILVAGELAACGRIEELVGSVPKSVELRASGINASLAAELKTRVSCFMEEEAGYCRFVVPDLDSANRAVKQIQDAGGSLGLVRLIADALA